MSDLKLNRSDVMKKIMAVRNNALVITGLGSPVWDLAASDHRPDNFYSWGGMGCAISMGLGCALAQSDKKVWVITGCLLYTSPSPRDQRGSRMPSSA